MNQARALHDAVYANDVTLLQQLISRGYSVNSATEDLVQPLHTACFHGHLECVRLLIDNGAEVNARNIDCATPLCDAASSGHNDCVKLLLKNGANVNPPLLLTSPLHEAAIMDQWQTVELLTQNGAILNSSDCHFGTPLHATASQGGIKSAEMLLRAGTSVNAIKSHKTALHDAASREDCDFISLLLEHGANPTAKDNSGNKPSDLVSNQESPARDLLLHAENSVSDLRQLCRLKIRQALGPTRLCCLQDLCLPTLLQDYLDYR